MENVSQSLFVYPSKLLQLVGMHVVAIRTIDECVENVLPVLLDQVVDVSENSAVQASSALFL